MSTDATWPQGSVDEVEYPYGDPTHVDDDRDEPDVDTDALIDAHYARLEVQADVDHDLRVLSFGHPGLDVQSNNARAAFLEDQVRLPPSERDPRFFAGLEDADEVGERDLDAEAREVIAHAGDPRLALSQRYKNPAAVRVAVRGLESEWEAHASQSEFDASAVAPLTSFSFPGRAEAGGLSSWPVPIEPSATMTDGVGLV